MPKLISFDDRLAKKLDSIPEAIILKEIKHWVESTGKSDKYNTFDGLRYTYNSLPELAEKFTCLSQITIRRALKSLKSKGLIITRSKGRTHDKRGVKWSNSYTINLPVYETFISSLLEVTPDQNDQVKQNDRIPDQNDQVKTPNVIKMIRYSQTTTNKDTTNTFPHKKDKVAPYGGEGAYTARSILSDNAIIDMSSTITELQNEFPNMSPEVLELNFKSQLNYWPKLNTSEVIKKTKARIYEQEISKKSGKVQRTIHTTGGAK